MTTKPIKPTIPIDEKMRLNSPNLSSLLRLDPPPILVSEVDASNGADAHNRHEK